MLNITLHVNKSTDAVSQAVTQRPSTCTGTQRVTPRSVKQASENELMAENHMVLGRISHLCVCHIRVEGSHIRDITTNHKPTRTVHEVGEQSTIEATETWDSRKHCIAVDQSTEHLVDGQMTTHMCTCTLHAHTPHTHRSTHAHTRIRTHTCVHAHMHRRTHPQSPSQTHTHTNTHTHTPSEEESLSEPPVLPKRSQNSAVDTNISILYFFQFVSELIYQLLCAALVAWEIKRELCVSTNCGAVARLTESWKIYASQHKIKRSISASLT